MVDLGQLVVRVIDGTEVIVERGWIKYQMWERSYTEIDAPSPITSRVRRAIHAFIETTAPFADWFRMSFFRTSVIYVNVSVTGALYRDKVHKTLEAVPRKSGRRVRNCGSVKPGVSAFRCLA